MLMNKDTILQELLILRCKRGDERAFTELIHLWEKRLFFYVRRLVATEEDAWDVLKQTWLKVFQGIKSLVSDAAKRLRRKFRTGFRRSSSPILQQPQLQ